MFSRVVENTPYYNLNNRNMWMVKIELKRIDTQKEVIVEVLLDSRATGLVMSSEFARK